MSEIVWPDSPSIGEAWDAQIRVDGAERNDRRIPRASNGARLLKSDVLDVRPGMILATIPVRSAAREVELHINPLSQAQWSRLEAMLASGKAQASDVMPGLDDVTMYCSCSGVKAQDQPCLHVLTAMFLLGCVAVADPFIMTTWLGKGGQALQAEVGDLPPGSVAQIDDVAAPIPVTSKPVIRDKVEARTERLREDARARAKVWLTRM